MKEEEELWQNPDEIVFNGMRKELSKLGSQVSDLSTQLSSIKDSMKSQDGRSDMPERLADCEVKLKKLWDLLTEKTPRGQDKLNKYGKMFGGKGSIL